jgi:hypothetical protein
MRYKKISTGKIQLEREKKKLKKIPAKNPYFFQGTLCK